MECIVRNASDISIDGLSHFGLNYTLMNREMEEAVPNFI